MTNFPNAFKALRRSSLLGGGLVGLALVLALLLAWWSSQSLVPGCGSGGDCATVLTSKWSQVFGMPVSLLGALTYLGVLITGRHQWGHWLSQVLMASVLAGALWFAFLQVVVLRAFCPWCCATHGLAVAGVLILSLARPGAVRPWREGRSMAVASLGLVSLISFQVLSAEPESTTVEAYAGAVTRHESAVAGGTTLSIHDGAFEIEMATVPCMGPLDADHVVVTLVDYTCSHCRQLHQSLEGLQKGLGDSLCVVSLPGVRGADSRQIHEKMLALFREDASAHALLSHRFFGAPESPTVEAVAQAVSEQLGGDAALSLALKNHREWIDGQLQRGIQVLAANNEKVGTTNLPQLIVGDQIIVGALRPDQLLALIQPSSSLETGTEPASAPPALVAEPRPDADGHLLIVQGEVDLKKVSPGQQITAQFFVRNGGQEKIALNPITVPSGWETIDQPPAFLPANGMAMIKIRAVAPEKEGPWEQVLLLEEETNDAARHHSLKVRGTILPTKLASTATN